MNSSTMIPITEDLVRIALATVDDPEYPGLSIADLGMVESIEVDGADVRVGLIPTFSGCPALKVMGDDVEAALARLPGIGVVEVDWLRQPSWTVERISPAARETMRTEFTVAVELGRGRAECPRCGTPTTEQSMFGPSRCRAVHHCPSCSETVEVMRS